MARKIPPSTEIDRLDHIKRLAIAAMFSDDDLMVQLVLKGGAALDLVHKVSARASVDVDLSLPGEFPFGLDEARARIGNALAATFLEHQMVVFDVTIEERPPEVSAEFRSFWGGYLVTFKLVTEPVYRQHPAEIEFLRRNAIQIGQGGTFRIDISKFEYCEGKSRHDMLGLAIYAYTPEMIVAEKLRAICQQSAEYAEQLRKHSSARARDFVDIYTVVTACSLDMTAPEKLELVRAVFGAKRVSLGLLNSISSQHALHRADFPSILATVRAGQELHDFDFYFDYVLNLARSLKSLWNV